MSKREADISETPVQEQELATQTHEEFTAVPEQSEPVSETENKQESIVLTNDSQEPSMLSRTYTKGLAGMPPPDSSRAPRYEEEPTELLEFFQSFEEIATACELKEEEKVKSVIRYTDKDTRNFWKSLDAYDAGKW